jgi:hypothetical protein
LKRISTTLSCIHSLLSNTVVASHNHLRRNRLSQIAHKSTRKTVATLDSTPTSLYTSLYIHSNLSFCTQKI